MAYPSEKLIAALLTTADQIEKGAPYQWGHMGACNCGNLAQVLTPYNKAEIHRFALEGHGDWNEQLREYCGVTKLPLDVIISMMLQEGLHTTDLMHLELLSDPEVLAQLPSEQRHLKKQVKADVVLYFRTWAALLQSQLVGMPKSVVHSEFVAH